MWYLSSPPQRQCRKYALTNVLTQIRDARGADASESVWTRIKETAAQTVVAGYVHTLNDTLYVADAWRQVGVPVGGGLRVFVLCGTLPRTVYC